MRDAIVLTLTIVIAVLVARLISARVSPRFNPIDHEYPSAGTGNPITSNPILAAYPNAVIVA